MFAEMLLLDFGQFSLLKDHVSSKGENHENRKSGCNSCTIALDKIIVRKHPGLHESAILKLSFGVPIGIVSQFCIPHMLSDSLVAILHK
jgi:hypothetical protein